MDDESLIEILLYRGEGTTLDYKVQQYAHDGASPDDKGELLKDILAFSNAWRDETAYILIGVNNSVEIVGLDKDLDDSRLQQFISEKTNSPVTFSYRSVNYKGVKLGLYTIPVQARPIFAKKQYGKVLPDTVYVRRGSATATAKPDEIAKMGAETLAEKLSPQLQVRMVGVNDDSTPVESLYITYKEFQLTEYPRYEGDDNERRDLLWSGLPSMIQANSQYYHQLARYIKLRKSTYEFKFEVVNSGTTFAEDVIIKISAPSESGMAFLTQLPAKPLKKRDQLPMPVGKFFQPKEIEITSERNIETMTFLVGKVRPGETIFTGEAYFARLPSSLTAFDVKVFADHLQAPIQFEIPVSVEITAETLTFDRLKAFSN